MCEGQISVLVELELHHARIDQSRHLQTVAVLIAARSDRTSTWPGRSGGRSGDVVESVQHVQGGNLHERRLAGRRQHD